MEHWDPKRRRRRAFVQLAVTGAAVTVLAAVHAGIDPAAPPGAPLLVEDRYRLPVSELSGLAVRADEDGPAILAIGDRNASLAVARLREGRVRNPMEVHDLGPLLLAGADPGADPKAARKAATSQWEGLALDGAGRVFMLQETTGQVVVLSPGLDAVLGRFGIDLMAGVAKRRGKLERSLGEGLVLLGSGHLLVAKESSPPVIVEFGPAGAAPLGLGPATVLGPGEAFAFPADGGPRLAALATWTPGLRGGGRPDLSEIVAAPGGEGLYSLSRNRSRISLWPPLDPARLRPEPVREWKVPARVRNPEALALLGSGGFLVGSDLKTDAPNLFRLRPEALDRLDAAAPAGSASPADTRSR